MGYIIGWLPFIIDILMIKKHPVCIWLIPFSLFLGLFLVYIYDELRITDYKKKGQGHSDACKKLEQDRDIAKVGMIGGVIKGLSDTKDCLKDISDVDHWKTKI